MNFGSETGRTVPFLGQNEPKLMGHFRAKNEFILAQNRHFVICVVLDRGMGQKGFQDARDEGINRQSHLRRLRGGAGLAGLRNGKNRLLCGGSRSQ